MPSKRSKRGEGLRRQPGETKAEQTSRLKQSAAVVSPMLGLKGLAVGAALGAGGGKVTKSGKAGKPEKAAAPDRERKTYTFKAYELIPEYEDQKARERFIEENKRNIKPGMKRTDI